MRTGEATGAAETTLAAFAGLAVFTAGLAITFAGALTGVLCAGVFVFFSTVFTKSLPWKAARADAIHRFCT